MKKSRTIMGLLLIIFAVFGLIFWEVKGRAVMLLDTVVVASETIPAGTAISREHLAPAGVFPENKVHKAYLWDSLPKLMGQVAAQDIVKNAQISEEHLTDNKFYIKNGESIFVIPNHWILMRSSSIRRGDEIDIYIKESLEKVGSYRVAFAKDNNEVEVTGAEGAIFSNPLDRTVSTSPISHVEIITTIDEYGKISGLIDSEEANLIIVQKEGILK